jgi:hypothetical protein
MVLAGCGIHPGAAAVVESASISHDEVDDVALAVCSANLATSRDNNQPEPQLGSRGARQVALQILIETQLSRQFGEHEGVEADPNQVSQAIAQNEPVLNLIPPDQRETFREALRDYAEGQLIVLQVGQDSLGGQATDEEAIQRGMRLRRDYVKTLDVEIDPRYGTFEEGRYTRGIPALSVPASDRAKAGSLEDPSPTFVAELPDTQQCS